MSQHESIKSKSPTKSTLNQNDKVPMSPIIFFNSKPQKNQNNFEQPVTVPFCKDPPRKQNSLDPEQPPDTQNSPSKFRDYPNKSKTYDPDFLEEKKSITQSILKNDSTSKYKNGPPLIEPIIDVIHELPATCEKTNKKSKSVRINLGKPDLSLSENLNRVKNEVSNSQSQNCQQESSDFTISKLEKTGVLKNCVSGDILNENIITQKLGTEKDNAFKKKRQNFSKISYISPSKQPLEKPIDKKLLLNNLGKSIYLSKKFVADTIPNALMLDSYNDADKILREFRKITSKDMNTSPGEDHLQNYNSLIDKAMKERSDFYQKKLESSRNETDSSTIFQPNKSCSSVKRFHQSKITKLLIQSNKRNKEQINNLVERKAEDYAAEHLSDFSEERLELKKTMRDESRNEYIKYARAHKKHITESPFLQAYSHNRFGESDRLTGGSWGSDKNCKANTIMPMESLPGKMSANTRQKFNRFLMQRSPNGFYSEQIAKADRDNFYRAIFKPDRKFKTDGYRRHQLASQETDHSENFMSRTNKTESENIFFGQTHRASKQGTCDGFFREKGSQSVRNADSKECLPPTPKIIMKTARRQEKRDTFEIEEDLQKERERLIQPQPYDPDRPRKPRVIRGVSYTPQGLHKFAREVVYDPGKICGKIANWNKSNGIFNNPPKAKRVGPMKKKDDVLVSTVLRAIDEGRAKKSGLVAWANELSDDDLSN